MNVPAHVMPYVEALGLDRAAAFLLEHGGTYFHPSTRFNDNGQWSRFADFLTDAERQALFDLFGAGKLRLPVPKNFLIAYLRSKGGSQSDIIRAVKMTDVSVRRVVNGSASLVAGGRA